VVLRIGEQGNRIFAISSVCYWQRRIAVSQWTLLNRIRPTDTEFEDLMPTDAAKRHEMQLALLSLITCLIDSQKGYADIGDHLKDAELKHYFLAESLKRAHFRGDLEEVLHQNGLHDIHESGSPGGKLHRAWGDLKAKLGGGDHTLLTSAEQGEDEVKDVYGDALRQDLPLPVRQLLADQQAHILTAHDYVRGHRDALARK